MEDIPVVVIENTKPTPRPQNNRSSTPLPVWHYERLTNDPRVLPYSHKIQEIIDSQITAQKLIEIYPDDYRCFSIQELTQFIENHKKRAMFSLINLTNKNEAELSMCATQSINKYRNFILHTYGVTLPNVEGIKIIPAEGINNNCILFISKGGLYPIIFVNIDVLKKVDLQSSNEHISIQVLKIFMNSLCHEYQHLSGDLAYWYFSVNSPLSQNEINKSPIMSGKLGLATINPRNKIWHGDQLNEAVTEKLCQENANDPSHDTKGYLPQINILTKLVILITKESNISKFDAFKLFVHGQNSPEGFRKLMETLSGKYITPDKKVHFRRKSFYKEICQLMNFEDGNNPTNNSSYPLTHELIDLAEYKNSHGRIKSFIKSAPFYLRLAKEIMLRPKNLRYLRT